MRGAQLHVYYGEGKGKTTAALGQALRCWGRGWRVLFVQFLKDARAVSGEAAAATQLGPRWRLLRASLPAPVLRDPGAKGRTLLREASRDLLERALVELGRRRYELLVLDEALVACHYRLLTVAGVRRAAHEAAGRGARMVILTGRWAPAGLLRAADLVTRLNSVRHPYDRGVPASDGIEF